MTRSVEGKGRFRTVAPDSRLLRPAGNSLGLFLYRYLDGIIIIVENFLFLFTLILLDMLENWALRYVFNC